MIHSLRFLVEDPSTEVFLAECLPGHLPENVQAKVVNSGGRQNMLRNLGRTVSNLSGFIDRHTRIIALIDCDGDNCIELKNKLEEICTVPGPTTGRSARGSDWRIAARIAMEEPESWYFGDWQAVCEAFPGVPSRIPAKRQYRDPDSIQGGTSEAFMNILGRHGYFKPGPGKMETARLIGRHIVPERNRSRSFNKLRDAVREAPD